MDSAPLYPLRIEPIYQYRLWGGRRLSGLLSAPLPSDGPIGEAWVLSDRDVHQSKVADGLLKGQTIGLLMEQHSEQVMGKLASSFPRFPLLLKFLDAQQMLSVQVHPSDVHPELLPPGEMSKTEAWVVIEAEKASRIYAGWRPGTTAADLRQALAKNAIVDHLNCIVPAPGDAVFIPAGTVFIHWAPVLSSLRFSRHCWRLRSLNSWELGTVRWRCVQRAKMRSRKLRAGDE